MSTPHLKHAPADEPAMQEPTAESLGWQLRAALPPLRLHSVSIYDAGGEVLWLSEGALGPDEHGFVVEALRALADDSSLGHCERDFDDGRGAVFLPVRSPQAALVGLVMILVDAKALAAGGLAARILAPPVRVLLQRLAILLRPAPAASAGKPAPATPRSAAETERLAADAPQPRPLDRGEPTAAEPAAASCSTTSPALDILEWSPPQPPVAAAGSTAQSSEDSEEILEPSLVEEILSFELVENAPPGRDSHDAHGTAAEPAPCELYVQELTRLHPGGRTRRLQLLPQPASSASPRGADAQSGSAGARRDGDSAQRLAERTLAEPLRTLAAWLDARSSADGSATLHFSIAVPPALLEVADLAERVVECIRSTGLVPDRIGFEIPETACIRARESTERLVQALERLGCFLVLDDFTFDSGALEILRSKALRLVKVDRALVRAALRDKLAQARVVAIAQAARVLGIHCAAKHVDALATQRWLAAAGFDFVEVRAGGPRPLAALAEKLADT